MRIKFVLAFFFLFASFYMSAQTVEEAENLFNKERYMDAYSIYEKLLSQRNDARAKALLNYKAGRCLVAAKDWRKGAENHFIISAERNYRKSYFYLGEIYFHQYKFAEAVENYNLYKEVSSDKLTDSELKQLDSCLTLAQNGLNMIQRVEEISIVDSIRHTKYNFFTAYNFGTDLGKIGFFEDIFPNGTFANIDGSAIFMTGRNDRMIFAQKQETQQYDLKISYRLIDGWTPEADLSQKLNTNADENYPFVLPDGVTIYFASKGHNSLGGYDIFFSRYSDAIQDYTEPQNIGMPFNSTANDYMLVIDEMSKVGWFVTDRWQHEDSVVVYKFIPNKERKLLQGKESDLLREYAQLKQYNRVVYNPINLSRDDERESQTNDIVEINFLVKDKLIYTHLSQFKSEDAKNLYIQYKDVEKDKTASEKLLEQKRKEYATIEDKGEQKTIYIEILSIEKNIYKSVVTLKELLSKIRLAEIETLNKADH